MAPRDFNSAVPLGIPLPPALGKQRIAFWAKREVIDSFELPPPLETTVRAAPPEWRPWLERVALEFSERGFEVRAYGSLLWQHHTGFNYLHSGSDLDLICTLARSSEFDGVAGAFEASEKGALARVDGEIFFPGLGWASWREAVQNASRSVLIKYDGGERLIERNELFSASAACEASR